MKNFLKNTVLVGVGLFSKAQKETEKAIRSLVKNNKITKKEGEAMLAKFVKDSKKFEKDLSSKIQKESTAFAKRVKADHSKDIVVLKKKLVEADKKIRKGIAKGSRSVARFVEGPKKKKAKKRSRKK